MTYQVEVSNYSTGRKITTLRQFGNIESARQAILAHSNTIDLPEIVYGANYYALAIPSNIESWIIADVEYSLTLE